MSEQWREVEPGLYARKVPKSDGRASEAFLREIDKQTGSKALSDRIRKLAKETQAAKPR
jgi:hypothetical protein